MFGVALFDDTTLFPSCRSNGDMKSPPKMDNSVSIEQLCVYLNSEWYLVKKHLEKQKQI